ncbi:OmpA family protein [Palleronia marisminoris]|uniref:Outer membrane lipoprotein Omp16 n=1 Tax=Palleronia marisminoris TaxID=315423 RepID=A0A1Y5T357_9RHOB|nr:OmpA family protein [Palleronia marisminoris]SFH15114.1 OmpA family protein [Palleronia marisminoris]SLN54700.1 Outer membrane lipoprotein Omp16 precursor [Palleronia marisminoris]
MAARTIPSAIGVALLTLAGCGETTGVTTWNAPLGSEVDEGGFGNATMNNMMVQSGRIGQVEGLNNRFSTEVVSVVTFAFDSATLSPQARAVIARQAAWIRRFPEVRFRVYGHTDLVGSDAYNFALGRQRAEAVVGELVRNGVNRARLEALVSFGETQPLIVTQGRERANRRTVTEVSGFVGRGGDLLYGKYAEIILREWIESATYVPQLDPASITGAGGEAAQ